MHPIIFQRFGEICSARNAGGAVLEIGAVPSEDTLLCLPCLQTAMEKVGINLDGPHQFRDFTIRKGNANAMLCFADESFNTILCNSTLEHDLFFWKTLAEIRRVAKDGALVVIGVDGYAKLELDRTKDRWERIPVLKHLVRRSLGWLTASTLTLQVHPYPDDYYRFSAEAVELVFFEDFDDVHIETVMVPPRIIGSGIWRRGLRT